MYFTEKQLNIMEFIQQFRAERGISPTLEEIAEYFGVTKITIYEHINQLERKGALKREKFRARSIELLVPVEERNNRFQIPMLGSFSAGSPLEVAEKREHLNIADLLPVGKRYYVLRVSDSSLRDANIAEGDYVIAESRTEPHDGETIIAVLAGGEATLKRYHNSGDEPYLCGIADASDTMDVKDVEIRGVVIGVLRHVENQTSRHPGSWPAVGSDAASA